MVLNVAANKQMGPQSTVHEISIFPLIPSSYLPPSIVGIGSNPVYPALSDDFQLRYANGPS